MSDRRYALLAHTHGTGSGGATQLSDLSDVTSATTTAKFALMADGAAYVGRALVEADISDLGTYATDSLAVHLAGAEIITGQKTFDADTWQRNSQLRLVGNSSWNAPSSSEGLAYHSTTLGLVLAGYGTTYDVLVANRAGVHIWAVSPNAQSSTFKGTSSVTTFEGLIRFGSTAGDKVLLYGGTGSGAPTTDSYIGVGTGVITHNTASTARFDFDIGGTNALKIEASQVTVATTLNVIESVQANGTVTNQGLTGVVAYSGVGGGTKAIIGGYDWGLAAYQPTELQGNPLSLHYNTTTMLNIASTAGMSATGTFDAGAIMADAQVTNIGSVTGNFVFLDVTGAGVPRLGAYNYTAGAFQQMVISSTQTNFTIGTTAGTAKVAFGGKLGVSTNADDWLYLNEDNAFTNGTYIADLLRIDGTFQLGNSGNTMTIDSTDGDIQMKTGVTGDRITLFGVKDTSGSYGFGIESGAMYHKSAANHRWYVNTNADVGVSAKMFLDASQLQLTNGTDLYIKDAGTLQIYDASDADWVTLSHDGTDFNITGTNTTDINITGVTSVNVPLLNSIDPTDWLTDAANETITGQWKFANTNYGIELSNAALTNGANVGIWSNYLNFTPTGGTNQVVFAFPTVTFSAGATLTLKDSTNAASCVQKMFIDRYQMSLSAGDRFALSSTVGLQLSGGGYLQQTGGGDIDLRDGGSLIVRDSGDTDYAAFSHDGTDFNFVGTNTTNWNISGANVKFVNNVGFYNTAPVAQPTSVAVTAAGIHAALVTLGLIT